MHPISHLLEQYYANRRPLGIAFVQSGSVVVGFGRPCNFALGMISSQSAGGLTEYRFDSWGACVYASAFRWDKFLVVQYPLDLDDGSGPPSSFIRLAAAIQRELETPSDQSGSGGNDTAAVPRQPRTPAPKSRSAEAEEPE